MIEVPGPTIPAVVCCAEARKRRVQSDNAGVLAFLKPGGQFIAAAYAEPTEIDDAEFRAAPLVQPRNALQRFQVVIERRADKDANLQLGTLSLPPVVKPVHKLLETAEWQRTSLA